jgi:hypothetical protein
LRSEFYIGHSCLMRNQEVKRWATGSDGSMASRDVNTVLRLPRSLYEHAERLAGQEQAGRVNDFIVKAVAAYVETAERKVIDDSFRGMANDKAYQREALQIVKEFGG